MDTDDVIDHCTDSCVDAIELGAPKFGQECVDVYEEVMSCLAEVSCEEYSALTFLPDTEQPCAKMLDPFYERCPGVFLAPDAAREEHP